MASKKTIERDMELAGLVNGGGTPMVNNLTLLPPSMASLPTIQPWVPVGSGDVTLGPTVVDMQQQAADLEAQYWAAAAKKYDLLMSLSKADLDKEGYFITTDNGSVFKGTMNSSVSFLPLQDFQKIENERGTPGALLMHFNEPALAKDTAGYEGGTSGTVNGQPPVVEPIPDVQNLPPVVKTDDGTVSFTEPPADTTNLGGTGTSLQSIAGGGKYWWLWYVVAVAAVIIYIKFIRK